MKVYIVGDHGPEHNHIKGIYKTYGGALKAWNELRESYLESAKHNLKRDKDCPEMWQEMVDNLRCDDPKKIDNYPHETPYIKEWEVQE